MMQWTRWKQGASDLRLTPVLQKEPVVLLTVKNGCGMLVDTGAIGRVVFDTEAHCSPLYC